MEVIEKDIVHPRLTITPNRVTLKFPPSFTDRDRITEFAERIARDHSVIHSHRGRFRLQPNERYLIRMNTCSRIESFTERE